MKLNIYGDKEPFIIGNSEFIEDGNIMETSEVQP